MDLGYLIIIIWVGCFLVVAIDSAFMKISPVFWRLVAYLRYSLMAWYGNNVPRNE
jgi:hypothetical protein